MMFNAFSKYFESNPEHSMKISLVSFVNSNGLNVTVSGSAAKYVIGNLIFSKG